MLRSSSPYIDPKFNTQVCGHFPSVIANKGAEALGHAGYSLSASPHSLRRVQALARYFSLQVRSRITRGPLVVPFIEDTTLIFKGGMDGRRADIAIGLFEFEEMAFVLHALREEELFVDVGANIGIYTVLAAGGGHPACPWSRCPIRSDSCARTCGKIIWRDGLTHSIKELGLRRTRCGLQYRKEPTIT